MSNIKFLLSIFLVFFLLSFYSCSDKLSPKNNEKNGGVVFTFDDYYIAEWKMADDTLSQYNWKATFNVSNLNRINDEGWAILKSFQDSGHEIAGHGMNHLNSKEYSKIYGVQKYVTDEIIPMITAFNQKGLNVSSYVYPYGARTTEIDNELSSYFNILRGTSYGNIEPESAPCIYEEDKLVRGLGIDDKYEHFAIDYYFRLLDYAKLHNKYVIFYAHKPVDVAEGCCQVSFNTLKILCEYCYENDMEFLRLKDLLNK